jgi:hypothetical protein
MPAWLLTILIKFVLPEVLSLLVNAKIISQAEADLIDTWEQLKTKLQNVKFYREYPNDPPGQTNVHNFTRGQK